MQIMCLNGWGGTLADDLLAYLADTRPDVLCLQEVVHSPASPKTTLTYRDGDHVLSQRANLFRDVCACLPDHAATFCPAARGHLWDGQTQVPSFWGLASFVHRDLTVIGQVQGFVHKDYDHHGFGDHPRSRMAHGVRIWHDRTDRPFSILQFHGLRDLAGKHDTPARLAQAHRLTDLMGQLAGSDDGKIICGDFNLLPNSETFRVLAQAGLTDLVTTRGFTTTRTRHYAKAEPFADYMCVSPDLAHARFEVVTTPQVSDHCPLILTL